MNPTPVFFKSIPLQLKLQGDFHLVTLATGFTKPVDPLSGMTVNLMKVIQWQGEFRSQIQTADFSGWTDFFSQAQAFFKARAIEELAEFSALQVEFFDRTVLRQDASGFFLLKKGPLIVDGKISLAVLRLEIQSDIQVDELLQTKLPADNLVLDQVSHTICEIFKSPGFSISLVDPMTLNGVIHELKF